MVLGTKEQNNWPLLYCLCNYNLSQAESAHLIWIATTYKLSVKNHHSLVERIWQDASHAYLWHIKAQLQNNSEFSRENLEQLLEAENKTKKKRKGKSRL